MSAIVPLTVAVPLLAAPILAGTGHFLPRVVNDIVGPVIAAVAVVLCAVLLFRSTGGTLVYWFGDWKPRGDLALGIAFTVDPLGAGFAFLSAVLVLAGLVYSWRYFDEAGPLFYVLMLLVLGGMIGFALSGDLFNLFVFLELMSVAAFALTAYRIDEEPSLQGAFNFGVTNTVGALLLLFGVGLLYGRTGALNLAQIGGALAGHEPDGLVLVSFVLILVGFLVKAGAVPFHFWLADAYAAAPPHVCVLLAGVMTEVGLLGIARVYWTVYADAFGGDADTVRNVLVGVGALTAIVGAVMCFLQRHVKRLLAYSSVAYTGVFLIGIALLTPDGLAGCALFVVAHAGAKGSLFLLAGLLLERTGDVDELRLRGRGRGLTGAGLTWLAATLALAGPPFVGAFSGHALIGDAAGSLGSHWIAPLLAAVTAVSTGAVLRAGARIFLGWGAADDALLSEEPAEHTADKQAERPIALLLVPAVFLAGCALAVGSLSILTTATRVAAADFTDRSAYAARVLDEREPPPRPEQRQKTTAESVVWAVVTPLLAVGVGLFGLYRGRLPRRVRAGAWRLLAPVTNGLRAAHSGHVGDYVAWLTVGTAALGGLFALGLT